MEGGGNCLNHGLHGLCRFRGLGGMWAALKEIATGRSLLQIKGWCAVHTLQLGSRDLEIAPTGIWEDCMHCSSVVMAQDLLSRSLITRLIRWSTKIEATPCY